MKKTVLLKKRKELSKVIKKGISDRKELQEKYVAEKPKRGRPKKSDSIKGIDKQTLSDISYKPKRPKVSVKKKVVPKIKPKRVSAEEREEIKREHYLDTVYDAVCINVYASKDMEILHSSSFSRVIVIAKCIELKVNRVNNQSVFQPYETNDVNKYCLLSVIEVGGVRSEWDWYSDRIAAALNGIDCPVYKINHIEEVSRVLDGIGKK